MSKHINQNGLISFDKYAKYKGMSSVSLAKHDPVSRFSTKYNEKFCQLSCWQRRYPLKQFFKIIRRHIVAVAVNIKGFNILKYKPIGMFVVNYMKSVKPFSFD